MFKVDRSLRQLRLLPFHARIQICTTLLTHANIDYVRIERATETSRKTIGVTFLSLSLEDKPSLIIKKQ